MEKNIVDRVKTALVFIFVSLGVILIIALWTNSLAAGGDEQPGFYRATPTRDVSFELTQSAAVENEPAGSGTPAPEPGQTPTPTEIEPTEGVDQVN